MSHIGTSQRGEGGDDRGPKITSTTNPMRIAHEAKVTTPRQSGEISQADVCYENQQSNQPLHHRHQPQQHLPLPNPQECSSNQSGSDSGLGYTNSISSENSSLIVNTTSLEKINAYNNSTNTIPGVGVIKFISNDKSKTIQITESDSFNIEPLDKAGQKNDSIISCNETGKIDAATTSIPNKAATTNDLSGNAHRIDAQCSRGNDKQQLTKSVKVTESVNNNVKTNQNNNLLSASLPMPRTKDELGSQDESFSDTNEESLANNAKVINNTDDGAKIKHSIRQGANQVAISTVRPKEYDDDGLDKTAKVSINREIQVPCAHLSGASQLSPVVNPIDSPPFNIVPFIKSSLKKTTGDRTVDAPKRTKHNRNVSFNQTVIVFCEEIDTSSPSETFEPPLDYQDAPSIDERQNMPGNVRGNLNRDFKSQNGHVSDDFDILSKIVGDDASSLTDDQLFGLLENGSLLKNFDLGENNKAFTIDRLNSDHSYLCHDAISDSESESSLTIDTHYKEVSTVNNKLTNSSTKSKESTLDQPEEDQRTGSQYMQKSDHAGNQASCNNLQTVDCYHESLVNPVEPVQQRSMPARVKVSTIDNSTKRQQTSTKAQVNYTDSALHITRSACPKVIQSTRQNSTKPEPMLIRLTNVEPAILSKTQMRDNIADINNRRQPTRDQEEHNVCSQTVGIKPNSTTNSIVMSNDQISSRDSRLTINDQHEQFRDSSSTQQHKASHTPNQPSNVVNAQVIQSNHACHICRAIESNLHQAKFCTQSERTGLMTNINSTLQTERAKIDQPQLQRSAHPHQFHPSGGATIESQYQKQLQPVLTSQSSCVPCRESSIKQLNCVTQPVRPNLANNLTDHQQARPIACQLVYVVDQCGNRMKALQVVGSAQMSLNNNQSMRPIMITPGSCRLPAPSTGQNFIRMSNPTGGQMVGVVRNAPVQTGTSHSCLSNQSAHLPMKEIVPSAVSQQQRMQIVSHSAPRNHTVYYVRQPLGSQDFRQSSSSVATSVARSFPDVHEIRRLDGIRAPTESPNLMQAMNQTHSNTSPGQLGNKSVMQNQVKDENRSLKLRRDESDDPTFGFSRRPAVKVVTNSVREFQTQSVVKANQNLNQAIDSNNPPRLLAGSQTLDRKSVQRDHSSQREVKENMPSTSSMSNINKTLTSYVGSASQARYENVAKSKETNVGQFIDINNYNMQTSHQTDNFAHPRRDRKDQDGPEVAYVMNL